jgi:hypothetical protein
LRDLCAETSFTTAHLVQPIFVVEGLAGSEAIPGLDGNYRFGIDPVMDAIGADVAEGVRHSCFLPFRRNHRRSDTAPSPPASSTRSSAALARTSTCGSISACARARTMATARSRTPITASTLTQPDRARGDDNARGGCRRGRHQSERHDGWPHRAPARRARQRRTSVRADHELQHQVCVAFYGPFRSAAGSAPRHGSREHYQIDVRSRTDAIGSSVRCANEGADLLMVKPGLTSLDLITPIREATGKLVGAYQVSGEYAGFVRARPRRPGRFRRGAHRDLACVPPRWSGLHHHLRRPPRPFARSAGVIDHAQLFARALNVAPGGVQSPVRAFRSVGGTPIFMQRAEGPRLVDVTGRTFIDFCQSFGPLLLGHRDADVRAVVQQALDDGWTYGCCEPYSLALAEWIQAQLPWVERIRFVSSGTEAVMSALRVARAATGRSRILKFDGCYHGHADSMLVHAGSGLAGEAEASSAGVSAAVAAETPCRSPR